MMRTEVTSQSEVAVASKAAAPSKTEPVYTRIPITEDILKSVVLKPPDQRRVRRKL
jgi:hypothetical protein